MTENKRFMLDDAGEVIDLQTAKFIEYGEEIVECLNTLHEENIQLRAFIKRLSNDCGEIILMNGIGYNVDKIFGDFE